MKTSKGISEAYKNIVGGNAGGSRQGGGNPASDIGAMHKGLDNLFSYQGKKYGDLPSYKVGGGGGESLDRLAQMMGGQIYNPYQYARMTSSGSSSGEFPYKSTLSAQEAAAQAKLQKMRGEQETALQKLRGEQETGLQKGKFSQEEKLVKQQRINQLQDALNSVKFGTPEYFEVQMELNRLRIS